MLHRLPIACGLAFALACSAAQAQAPAAPALPAAQEQPQLTPEQITAMRQRFRDSFMRLYDTNRDGVVTREEYDAARDAQFRRADTNGDGALSEAEYVAEFEARLRAERGDRPVDDQFRRAIEQASRRFESIDRSRDLSISREEYDTVAARTFARTDTNNDGRVTATDPLVPHGEAAPAARN